MRKERVSATVEVAKQLFLAETAVDQAYQAIAELNAKMSLARIQANISAVVGQDALESASESLSALAQARHQLVKTHHRLDDVKTGIGLRELAVGGMSPKHLTEFVGLSVVSTAA